MSSFCLSPYQSKGNISLPCGKCANCRKKQSYEWAFRMKKEIEYFPDKKVVTYFLTLTYDDEHLPKLDGKVSLRRVDYTKFIKRIRQQLKRDYGKTVKLSIIGCGEYGDKSGRPHYHCVIHGIPFTWKGGCFSVVARAFEEKWRNGFVDLRLCDGNVASYVTKYSVKNLDKSRKYYEVLGVEPPFRCYSQGIGLNYFEQNRERICREGFCRDGKYKVAIPRYFKDRFFLFSDYVRSCKVVYDRSVELLRKDSLVTDDYVLDTERLAYLSKYSDKIQRLIGRLSKRCRMWMCCLGSIVVFRKYVYPMIDNLLKQVKSLEGMLMRAFSEMSLVLGYQKFQEVLYRLREKERMLACQARDDLMSKNFFRKRLC